LTLIALWAALPLGRWWMASSRGTSQAFDTWHMNLPTALQTEAAALSEETVCATVANTRFHSFKFLAPLHGLPV
jgi:hypothetical protein